MVFKRVDMWEEENDLPESNNLKSAEEKYIQFKRECDKVRVKPCSDECHNCELYKKINENTI